MGTLVGEANSPSTSLPKVTEQSTSLPVVDGRDEEPMRDPPRGDTFASEEDSTEFFDGAVVVSLGQADYRDSTHYISVLTMRVGVGCWKLTDVTTGDAFRVASDPQFEVQIRSVDFSSARLVVFRHEEPDLESLAGNC
ncbi:MAG TPA: hypothetical protein VM848_01165 [Acidimicrobiia bacterium]|nr:hypothetical protein [Acidimicrobiia bacterium]